jgi:hypothetical protein
MRVAPCHRGPRLSRIDPVKAAAVEAAAVRRREDQERVTTSSCTDRFPN